MTITYRPLGKIRNIVQSTGFDISYAYDDLVFSDNSVFIIQFDDYNMSKLHLYFNTDCDKIEMLKIEQELMKASKIEDFTIINKGLFSLEQVDGKDEISIRFQEDN